LRGNTRTDLANGALETFPAVAWLEDDGRPLDWNGPATRAFAPFRDDNLQRPIVEQFEQVVRRQRDRIAVREADTVLTYGELWDGVSGLAERLAADTERDTERI
jgi:hypothetical protein